VVDLKDVIKAYDIRGVVPEQLNSDLARAVGTAFVRVCGISVDAGGPGAVVIGHDMRPSGPDLVAAFADGVTAEGVDVIEIGLCSTDGLYYASGALSLPGAMLTASHNPAKYNGIKLCRPGAAPVGQDSGLREIRELLETQLLASPAEPGDGPEGVVSQRDMLADYAQFLRDLVPLQGRRLKVVIDAGNGMGGFTVPAVLGDAAGLPALPLNIVPMYFELDGNFPNHEANPIDPANLVDLQNRVVAEGADIGLAFDGDADRCFVVDEAGHVVNPSTLTALIAVRELAKAPGATIIYNLITSKAVAEIVTEHGGIPLRTRVGHSFIKAEMARTGAVFGGEHSGHFYFRDFWNADSGMLAAMHALAALSEAPAGTTLSSLLLDYQRYSSSGEINTEVADAAAALATVRAEFAGPEFTTDELDGLTVKAPTWWFNVRASNTEPLLRLNVEGDSEADMKQARDRVLALIRG
jgi:phosphomannomutase